MKLFSDMTPLEKLEHIKRMMTLAKLESQHYWAASADILDFWDYWVPYMLKRMRKLEAVAEAAKAAFPVKSNVFGRGIEYSGRAERDLVTALAALEADA